MQMNEAYYEENNPSYLEITLQNRTYPNYARIHVTESTFINYRNV